MRKATTVPQSFFACNQEGNRLFSVTAAVPAADALASASCLLSAALAIGHETDLGETETGAGIACLVEMAKAALDAAISGALSAEVHHG